MKEADELVVILTAFAKTARKGITKENHIDVHQK